METNEGGRRSQLTGGNRKSLPPQINIKSRDSNIYLLRMFRRSVAVLTVDGEVKGGALLRLQLVSDAAEDRADQV